MLFNLEWLKDYVEIDIPAEELADRLTMLGHEVESVYKEDEFYILDIDLTPNRSDCMNYLGLAREIAAMLNKKITLPDIDYRNNSKKSNDYLKIEIDSPDKVRRFAGHVLLNVKISKSPEWMQRRLSSVGVRAVNDIVDITNYVLLETGQPMHAYDLDLLSGSKLIGREASKGETTETLDGENRILESGDIVITDAEKIVGLGGIMGSANTEISESTKNIALEAAWFDPIQIRKTSKRLALSTDASYRFEREADINAPLFSIDRCCHLISKYTKAEILSDKIDVYPNKKSETFISFRPERARKLIGLEFEKKKIQEIFGRLEFKLTSTDQYRWKVQIPTYRTDIEKEVDLIEEVARFYGYNEISATLPQHREGAKSYTEIQKIEREIKRTLVSFGLQQVFNYSFSSSRENEIFGTLEEKSVRILNPLADNMDYLRSSLLPGLIKSASLNYNYGIKDISIFETGIIFKKDDDPIKINENLICGIAIAGEDYPVHWSRESKEITFYHLKGIIEGLPVINSFDNIIYKKSNLNFLHKIESAVITLSGKTIGHLGKISENIAAHFDIEFPLFVAELDLKELSVIGEKSTSCEPISRYQPVTRDIAIIIDESISYNDLISYIKKLKLDVLKKVNIFDIFRGDKIPEGKKSVALNLVFLSDEGSFTSDEVNHLQEKIINGLKKQFSAVLHQE